MGYLHKKSIFLPEPWSLCFFSITWLLANAFGFLTNYQIGRQLLALLLQKFPSLFQSISIAILFTEYKREHKATFPLCELLCAPETPSFIEALLQHANFPLSALNEHLLRHPDLHNSLFQKTLLSVVSRFSNHFCSCLLPHQDCCLRSHYIALLLCKAQPRLSWDRKNEPILNRQGSADVTARFIFLLRDRKPQSDCNL